MQYSPKVSIMVPFHQMNDDVKECILHCSKLDYPNFELILLPDFPLKKNDVPKTKMKIKIIHTGKVHPSLKRNAAIINSNADLCAALDSDAYPLKDWLKNAVPFFKDPIVGGIGGPNRVAKGASPKEEATAETIYSKLGLSTANYKRKYQYNGKLYPNVVEVKELALSNFILRREVLVAIGGFTDAVKTGEDTVMCKEFIERGYKFLDSPNVIVHHHRRPLFKPHLTRVLQQAADKAIILKNYFAWENLISFTPTMFLLFIILGAILSFFHKIFLMIYLVIILFYSTLVIIESSKTKHFFLVALAIPLTHITYGAGFLRGLLTRRKILPRKSLL